MRTIKSTALFALLTSLTIGCAAESTDTDRNGPGGKADEGAEEGLHVRSEVTTLGPQNEIRWPVVVDDASDVDDLINEALRFEIVTGENLEDIVREWSTGDEETVHQGIVAATYQTHANIRNVLSLSVEYETVYAYSDFHTSYQNFNTLTGERVAITDILDESALPAIAAQLDERLQEEIATLKTDLAADIESGEVPADQWDGLHVSVSDLAFFSTTPDGITFHYYAGFPHATVGLQPAGEYALSLEELDAYISADGLWADEY